MRVLLVGAGRMGLRHLQGLDGVVDQIDVVDQSMAARVAARSAASPSVVTVHGDLGEIPSDARFDAAIIASTAVGRLEIIQAVLARRVPAILLEKPLDQSRSRARALIEHVTSSGAKVWINHYRRTLTGFEALKERGPLIITVSSGAMGLGVNGIHWIDFVLHLTGAKAGKLLFGEIEKTVIASGRGTTFCDYGGRGIFGFSDGSRLMLSCAGTSSAPTVLSIVAKDAHWIVDQQTDRAWRHARAADANHPTYLYGKDYHSEVVEGLEAADLVVLTTRWISAVRANEEPPQPLVTDVQLSYDLLFDLLETSGQRQFHFT